jgi:hypothetical protein
VRSSARTARKSSGSDDCEVDAVVLRSSSKRPLPDEGATR